MNFDFVLTSDQETLRRRLVYFHTQCPTREMWSTRQYRQVVQLMKKRPDATTDFIRLWLEELRPYSLYD